MIILNKFMQSKNLKKKALERYNDIILMTFNKFVGKNKTKFT